MLAISFATRFWSWEASSPAICFLSIEFSLYIILIDRLRSITSLVASFRDYVLSSFSLIIRWMISCFWASSLAKSCHFCRSCGFWDWIWPASMYELRSLSSSLAGGKLLFWSYCLTFLGSSIGWQLTSRLTLASLKFKLTACDPTGFILTDAAPGGWF
mgnify:CR=1 FL=1